MRRLNFEANSPLPVQDKVLTLVQPSKIKSTLAMPWARGVACGLAVKLSNRIDALSAGTLACDRRAQQL